MRVARRDVRIVIANEIALQRDINYPATRGSLKSNNKLLRPVIGLAHIHSGFLCKKTFKKPKIKLSHAFCSFTQHVERFLRII